MIVFECDIIQSIYLSSLVACIRELLHRFIILIWLMIVYCYKQHIIMFNNKLE